MSEEHTYFTEVEARQKVSRTVYAAQDLPNVPAGTLGWTVNLEEAPNGEGFFVWVRWDPRGRGPFRYMRLRRDEFEAWTTI